MTNDRRFTCENCHFFIPPSSGMGYGKCVRFPKAEDKLRFWWCGEHSATQVWIPEYHPESDYISRIIKVLP